MTKRIVYLLLALFGVGEVWSSTIIVDGLRYVLNLTEKTAEVDWVDENIASAEILAKVTDGEVDCSVTSIGSRAFENGVNLVSVTIPESVNSIGSEAFFMCEKLANIAIKAPTPPMLGKNAFDYVLASSISVPCGMAESYEAAEGWKGLGKTFEEGHTEYAIFLSSNIKEWGTAKVAHADCGSPAETITATPASDEFAFVKWSDGNEENPRSVLMDKDTALTAVFRCLGDSTELEVDGLRYLFDLVAHTAKVVVNEGVPYSQTAIDIPDTVVMDAGKYAVVAIGDAAFANCDSLKSITIPEGVTSIGAKAFSQCVSLDSVTIPSSVTNIGNGAFFGDGSLKSITLPKGLTRIEDATFQYCKGLKSITIPESVTSIGYYAFLFCGFDSITIPERVETIGYEAFLGTELTSVTISGNRTNIEPTAFLDSPNLTSVTISGDTTIIGGSAFSGCPNLTSVLISGDTVTIGERAFMSCPKLESVVIAKGVADIGEYAFSACKGLKSITGLDEGEVSIGNYAFVACLNLTTISIAKGVGKSESTAFRIAAA